MRPRLLELLRCPKCQSRFEASCFEKGTGDEIARGVLTCRRGATYPIVSTIPRVRDNALKLFPEFRRRDGTGSERHGRPQFSATDDRFTGLMAKTQASFGYQWTTFSEMVCDLSENFWSYLHRATPEFFAE